MKLHPTPIHHTAELTQLCKHLKTADLLAFDTEFTHKTTYWAELCLIQIATTHEAFLIDPLAEGIDLSPLLDLLVSSPIPKIVHAGIQDAEILYAFTGRVPHSLFDTQIMTRYCTTHYNISLSSLVRHFLGVTIDKQEQLSDWSMRPLSDDQCQYALGDVIYLPKIFNLLSEKIAGFERTHIVEQELQEQYHESIFTQKPDLARKKLKVKPLSAKREFVLQELAKWREQIAMNKNVPRKYVASDQILLTIAQRLPKKHQDIDNLSSLPSFLRQKANQKKVLSIVEQSATHQKTRTTTHKAEYQHASLVNEDILLLLDTLLRQTATEQQIAPQALMTRKQMKEFLEAPHQAKTEQPQWKWQAFGEKAQQLIRGNIAITVAGDQIKLVEI